MVKDAVENMKIGKAIIPNDILIEVKCLGNTCFVN